MSESKQTLEIALIKDTRIEDLRLLKHTEGNPKRMTIKQKEQLWRYLKRYGWLWSIVTDSNGIMADREQRIEVCIAHDEFFGPVLRRNRARAQNHIAIKKHSIKVDWSYH